MKVMPACCYQALVLTSNSAVIQGTGKHTDTVVGNDSFKRYKYQKGNSCLEGLLMIAMI